MLADKTAVERGHAWLVKSSFCQEATNRHTHTNSHTGRRAVHEEERQEKEREGRHYVSLCLAICMY